MIDSKKSYQSSMSTKNTALQTGKMKNTSGKQLSIFKIIGILMILRNVQNDNLLKEILSS